MDHILFKYSRLFWVYTKKAYKPLIRIYIKKIENRITFKTKAAYYLEILTPELMKLLGSTKSKITKIENGEKMPHLEIIEFILVPCNYQQNFCQKSLVYICS